MTVIYPDATPILGNLKVKAVLTIADMTAPKLATEINAASSLDLTCFLRPFQPGVSPGSGAAPNRICTTTSLPGPGRTEFSAFELHYVYAPQEAPTTSNNKALSVLQPGVMLYLLLRKGLDGRLTDFAVGQRCEVWKVLLQRQDRGQSGDGDQDEFEVVQNALPRLEPVYDAVVAA